jgi:FAD:protein FMN transferase
MFVQKKFLTVGAVYDRTYSQSTILTVMFILLWLGVLAACSPAARITELAGNTMGTTYHLTYTPTGNSAEEESRAVEALLAEINHSLSTYSKTSVISGINASTDTTAWHPVDAHFEAILRRSREIYEDTDGAFNPAVGPLVNAWGFGPDGPQALPNDDTIRALLKVASLEAFELRLSSPASAPAVRKQIAGSQLDFGAIAQGYAVDAICALLERWGVRNYFVELGGELRTHGQHPDGRGWRVGIEKPEANAGTDGEIQARILLNDAALATSGNYRNVRVQEGKTIAHILNPRTGYPALSSLLSVSVVAGDATTADAYATALIVMGLDEGLRFVEARKGLHAYFIAKDSSGNAIEKRSSGFPPAIED